MFQSLSEQKEHNRNRNKTKQIPSQLKWQEKLKSITNKGLHTADNMTRKKRLYTGFIDNGTALTEAYTGLFVSADRISPAYTRGLLRLCMQMNKHTDNL